MYLNPTRTTYHWSNWGLSFETFTQGVGLAGYGQSMYNLISSPAQTQIVCTAFCPCSCWHNTTQSDHSISCVPLVRFFWFFAPFQSFGRQIHLFYQILLFSTISEKQTKMWPTISFWFQKETFLVPKEQQLATLNAPWTKSTWFLYVVSLLVMRRKMQCTF